jgi:uncharacterized coiled-coil protein SlyX
MSRHISLRLAIAAILAAAVLPLAALAQSQDSPAQSVADAARRAREKKKAAEKQPAPVITDDTLKRSAPASPEANAPAAAPSSEAALAPAPAAQPPAASPSAPDASATPTPAGQPAPTGDKDQKAKDSAELAALKKQLAEAQKNLELVRRELGLEQDNVYSKTNYASDTAGKAKLNDLKQQITDKQQAVDALKSKLAALLESSVGTAPAAPAPPPQI